jgi:hypothetical protein
MCITPLMTARSEPSRMTFGDWPPNSWQTRLRVGRGALGDIDAGAGRTGERDHINIRMLAHGGPDVRVEAVDQIENTFGTPASCRISAKISADDGVNSLGFRIMVQPAASAGATLQAIWFSGQFHGVIMPMTPTGSGNAAARPRGCQARRPRRRCWPTNAVRD